MGDDRDIRPETLKLLKESIKEILQATGTGRDFLTRTPTAQKEGIAKISNGTTAY